MSSITKVSVLSKLTLLGAGLGAGVLLGIATGSFAQSFDPDYGTGNVNAAYMVQPDGSMTRLGGKNGTVNAAGNAMALAHGTELPSGSIIYRNGKKMYAVKNQMIDGKTLEEHAKSWVQ